MQRKASPEQPQKSAPIASATTSAPEKTRPSDGLRWKTLAEVHDELGPSPTYIREAIADEAHPLAYKVFGGKWCVQKTAVKDWIRAYAGRRAPKLKEPLDYDSEPASEGRESGVGSRESGVAPSAEDVMDVLKILGTVDCTGGGEGGVELQKLKIALAEALRRQTDSEIARQKLFKGEDVVKMIRSHGELFCELIEEHCSAQAADLVKQIREKMDVDIPGHFSGATLVVAAILCEQANRLVIPALRREVLQQVEGVMVLEGVA